MPRLLLLVVLSLLPLSLLPASPLLSNIQGRSSTSLNGKWHAIVDPYETGAFDYRRQAYDKAENPSQGFFLDQTATDKTQLIEYNFDDSPTLQVPGDWNSQEERLFLYEGTVWYRRRFDAPTRKSDSRLFLYFGGANYQADVYLNGKKLGRHVGGFTPFCFEITDSVRQRANSLVVRVDNKRLAEGVPTVNTDWWNYGGLTRDVLLAEVPQTFIARYNVQLKKGSHDCVEYSVQLDGPAKQQKGKIEIDGKAEVLFQTDERGLARGEVTLSHPSLWSPDSPRLHAVSIQCDTDHIDEKIGFRSIETRGADILLNGQPVFLRGISLHEENPLRGGRASTPEEARLLLGWAKELGCNFVRLAHYPHNEYMVRIADELGLMLWEEIPVYWTIQWENPETLANSSNQLTELIGRDINRASVVVWSVANETPVSEPRTRFLKHLVDTARSLDNARLVSAAMEVHADPANSDHKIVDDPFGEYTDLLSFNQYVGWYDGLPDKIDRVSWSIKYTKPVFISEFGADALQGYHADALTRFSEEYQADLYRRTLAMLEKIPQWRGATPWILCDFRSPRRLLPHVEDGWNRKGLIGQNGTRKQAFFILQSYYQSKVAAAAGR
jgi:beta-glucuronidase